MHKIAKLLLLGVILFTISMQTSIAANDLLFKKQLEGGINAIRAKKWQEAEQLLSKSLVEAEKFGPDDSRVAASLVNLAVVRCNSKNFAEAISMSKRALAIDEKCFGKCADVAYDYHQLGTYLDVSGKHAEATPYLKKALEWRRTIPGVEPMYVALTLGNLGENYNSLHKDADAIAAYKESAKIYKESKIPPQYFQDFDRLRDCYAAKNQLDKVYDLYNSEVADLGHRFGPDSPWVNLMLTKEGAFLFEKKEFKRAEPVFRRLVEIAPQAPAGRQVAEAGALNGLAVCQFKQEKYADAHDSFKRSLAVLGPNGNPDQVQAVKLNMADCLDKLGKKKEAADMRIGFPAKKK